MIKLGETEFTYGIITNTDLAVRGSIHVMADGSNRVQYAQTDKYIFSILITYANETIWEQVLAEKQNSKLNDLNFIDHGGNNHTVRFVPETLNRTPIMGTALGYDITFQLIEV
jgi:hypothetical protein